jgi:hypothetical protein
MEQRRRIGRALAATAILGLALSYLVSRPETRLAPPGADHVALRAEGASPRDPERSSETHRPGTPARRDIEARRDDGPSRRPAPDSRAALESVRHGSRRADRVPDAARNQYAAASAALFHEANAPPEGLSAVAGRRHS